MYMLNVSTIPGVEWHWVCCTIAHVHFITMLRYVYLSTRSWIMGMGNEYYIWYMLIEFWNPCCLSIAYKTRARTNRTCTLHRIYIIQLKGIFTRWHTQWRRLQQHLDCIVDKSKWLKSIAFVLSKQSKSQMDELAGWTGTVSIAEALFFPSTELLCLYKPMCMFVFQRINSMSIWHTPFVIRNSTAMPASNEC